MSKPAIARLRKDLWAAERAIHGMESARSFDEFEEAWLQILNNLGKLWEKLDALSKAARGTFLGWYGQQAGFRRDDPLLRYLHHARNADQHTMQAVIAHQPGTRSISVPGGPGEVHIKHLEIRGGKVLHYQGSHPLTVKEAPARVELLRVEDRGVGYDPPTAHLGIPLSRLDPTFVAKTGVDFHRGVIDEAAEKYLKQ